MPMKRGRRTEPLRADRQTSDLKIPGVEDVVEVERHPWATTFRVRDAASSKVVRVRVVNTDEVSDASATRYLDEQSVLASFGDHPHIVTVHGHGRTEDGRPFVALDEAPDRTALHLIRESHTGPEVLSMAIQAAGALESVHRGGFTHGALRPEALHVIDDHVVLGDFGLTHLTPDDRDRIQALTWYSAPELRRDLLPTPATDQYSLAATIHYLLCGHEPADPTTVDQTAADAHTCLDLSAYGAPEMLTKVLRKALAIRPEQRWLDVEDFGFALQEVEIWLGLPLTIMHITTPTTRVEPTWPPAPPKPPRQQPTGGAPLVVDQPPHS